MAQSLTELGVVVDHPEPGVYEVAAGDVEWLFVPLEAAAKMRASFILLGPLLSRFGRVIMSNPGGDRIGRRPVNLHVEAMRALGALIEYRNGYYFATAPGRLRGTDIQFPFVTVMGTENAMLAATLAEGHTTIRPAAQEPEVDDLITFLQKMGAEVERTHPDTIEIEGRRRLRGAEHRVVPDRIEAGTFIAAAAVTGGRVRLESAPCDHLGAFVETMQRAGVGVDLRQATRSRSTVRRCSTAASTRSMSRPPPIPGWRPTSSRRPASSSPRPPGRPAHPRDDLRGPPRMADRGPPHGRPGGAPRRAPRRHHGPLAAPWRGGRDRRSTSRRLAHPRGTGRRGHVHHPRCTPRSPRL